MRSRLAGLSAGLLLSLAELGALSFCANMLAGAKATQHDAQAIKAMRKGKCFKVVMGLTYMLR